jgi:hypothetical protein
LPKFDGNKIGLFRKRNRPKKIQKSMSGLTDQIKCMKERSRHDYQLFNLRDIQRTCE